MQKERPAGAKQNQSLYSSVPVLLFVMATLNSYMIAINSTNVVTLSSLFDQIAAGYVNDATVTADLVDATGTVLYTFSLPYLPTSDGNYRGSIPFATAQTLTQGANYTVQLTIDSGSNQLFLVENTVAEFAA